MTRRRSRVHEDFAEPITPGAAEFESLGGDSNLEMSQPVGMSAVREVAGGNEKSESSRRRSAAVQQLLERQDAWSSAALVDRNDRPPRTHAIHPKRAIPDPAASSSDDAASDSDESGTDDSEQDSVSEIISEDVTADSEVEEEDLDGDENEEEGERQPEGSSLSVKINQSLAPVLNAGGHPRRQLIPDDDRRASAGVVQNRDSMREFVLIRISPTISAKVQRRLRHRLREENPGALILPDDSPSDTLCIERASLRLL